MTAVGISRSALVCRYFSSSSWSMGSGGWSARPMMVFATILKAPAALFRSPSARKRERSPGPSVSAASVIVPSSGPNEHPVVKHREAVILWRQ